MPSLTFVLPHWLYWAGLVIFPLAAMYIVRRRTTGNEGEVNLPTAYLFWATCGFVGIHRYYVRSLLGIVYLPLFLAVVYGNVEIRNSREHVSNANNQVLIHEFDLENAEKALSEGRDGAAQALEAARKGLEDAKVAQVTALENQADWDTFTVSFAVAIALLLLIDATLLPRKVRTLAEQERIERANAPAKPLIDVRAETSGRGHPADNIHTPLTRMVDWLSGFSGEFVGYWSLLAVFVYYYEVVARYMFNSPTNWAHESMFLMFGMQYLISGALALREDSHVRVDVIYLMFSVRTRAILNVITSVFFFLFCGALLWTGIIFSLDSIAVWEVSFTEWAIQFWPVKLTIALGALLILAQGLATLMRDVLYLRGVQAQGTGA